MKRVFSVVITMLACTHQLAFADDTANIKLNISGSIHDNRYFLCEPTIGCLSIYAAQKKNKTYSIYHAIDMDNLYVTNVTNMSLYSQGLPKSCNVQVNINQTITISGTLIQGPNNSALIHNLRCALS